MNKLFVDSVNNALCEDAGIFQNIRDQFSELKNKIDSLEKKISELEAESYWAYWRVFETIRKKLNRDIPSL